MRVWAMAEDDDGHRILRLSLRGGRKIDDGRILSQAMRRLRNAIAKNGTRTSRRAAAKMRGARMSGGYKPSMQRCAVRMSFSANKAAGQWAAHGRYIAREGANSGREREQGFTASGSVNVGKTLDGWQANGDPRMFKLILSPEFGSEMAMQQFTRDFMAKLEQDMGVPLEWVAVDHYNTDHPHVHVALRGMDKDGNELLIRPDYVKTTLRHRAQEVATEQLGHRTERQQHMAFDREVSQRRFTSLDKMLQKKAAHTHDGNSYVNFNDKLPKSEAAKKMRLFQIRRMVALEKMGLATPTGHMQWALSGELENTLRKMQESGDILKTMYSARDIASDPRMPVRKLAVLQPGQSIEGRLIATGQEENTGKPYLLVESLDGIVHHLYQTQAMQKARGEGALKRGDYLTVESKEFDKNGKKTAALVMRNHGSSHKLLADKKHLAGQILRAVRQHKALPEHRPMIGWLGEYQKALKDQAAELLRDGVIRPGAGGGYEVAPARQPQQPRLQMQEKKRGLTR
jgi:type IV secretory pathway VirD2 relaxase